jgi:hypothetical protein
LSFLENEKMCEREHAATAVMDTPLPVDIAAVWGAFLFEGLMVSTLNTGRASEILDRWGNGCIELVAITRPSHRSAGFFMSGE